MVPLHYQGETGKIFQGELEFLDRPAIGAEDYCWLVGARLLWDMPVNASGARQAAKRHVGEAPRVSLSSSGSFSCTALRRDARDAVVACSLK